MVDRQEVESLLEACAPGSEAFAPAMDEMTRRKMRALCRSWLALDEAPIRMVGDSISYGVSVAGTGMVNGQRVRIVKDARET